MSTLPSAVNPPSPVSTGAGVTATVDGDGATLGDGDAVPLQAAVTSDSRTSSADARLAPLNVRFIATRLLLRISGSLDPAHESPAAPAGPSRSVSSWRPSRS